MSDAKTMLELLPCPFCGGEARSDNGFSPNEIITYAYCSNSDCPFNSETIFTPEQWNTRAAAPSVPVDMRERLPLPSREVVAREIRRAMLDNPTDDSFNERAKKREVIADGVADVIIARFVVALPQPPARTCATCHAVLADGPQPAMTYASPPAAQTMREALELAEDVLSRSPFSTAIWPNGMHPQTGIEKIRAALAASDSGKDNVAGSKPGEGKQ